MQRRADRHVVHLALVVRLFEEQCQRTPDCATQPAVAVHSNACPRDKPWNIPVMQGPDVQARAHTCVHGCAPMFLTCKLTVETDC